MLIFIIYVYLELRVTYINNYIVPCPEQNVAQIFAFAETYLALPGAIGSAT